MIRRALRKIDQAIDALRKDGESLIELSFLEAVRGRLMDRTYGAAPAAHMLHSAGDWTLGADEPRPSCHGVRMRRL